MITRTRLRPSKFEIIALGILALLFVDQFVDIVGVGWGRENKRDLGGIEIQLVRENEAFVYKPNSLYRSAVSFGGDYLVLDPDGNSVVNTLSLTIWTHDLPLDTKHAITLEQADSDKRVVDLAVMTVGDHDYLVWWSLTPGTIEIKGASFETLEGAPISQLELIHDGPIVRIVPD